MDAIFIDLDRTLITESTTLIELKAIVREVGLFTLTVNLLQLRTLKKVRIKVWLSDSAPNIDYTRYLNEKVIRAIQKNCRENTKIVLATASLPNSVNKFLEYCPIDFDHLITSSNNFTIKGKKKLVRITEFNSQYGIIEFTYFGDSFKDFQIFNQCTRSYFVGRHITYLVGKFFYPTDTLNRLNS